MSSIPDDVDSQDCEHGCPWRSLSSACRQTVGSRRGGRGGRGLYADRQVGRLPSRQLAGSRRALARPRPGRHAAARHECSRTDQNLLQLSLHRAVYRRVRSARRQGEPTSVECQLSAPETAENDCMNAAYSQHKNFVILNDNNSSKIEIF